MTESNLNLLIERSLAKNSLLTALPGTTVSSSACLRTPDLAHFSISHFTWDVVSFQHHQRQYHGSTSPAKDGRAWPKESWPPPSHGRVEIRYSHQVCDCFDVNCLGDGVCVRCADEEIQDAASDTRLGPREHLGGEGGIRVRRPDFASQLPRSRRGALLTTRLDLNTVTLLQETQLPKSAPSQSESQLQSSFVPSPPSSFSPSPPSSSPPPFFLRRRRGSAGCGVCRVRCGVAGVEPMLRLWGGSTTYTVRLVPPVWGTSR